MSLRQSLRRLMGRNSLASLKTAQRGQRRWANFERLEARAMMTGVSGDFDGDGFDDLAIAAPNDAVGGAAQAGSVQVVYGSPSGLQTVGNRLFTLNSSGLGGSANANDHFGSALAVGDFDGDGYDDLAIGASGDSVGGADAGAVYILYGSRHGLQAQGSQRFHENTSGISGVAHDGDLFGAALASGDFNHDGRSDLAVGSPGKKVNGFENAGAVNVIYGSKSGLSASHDRQWTQDSSGVEGVAKAGDQFGFSLATGDFNGNGRDDLAIGIIGEKVAGLAGAGAVYIMYGNKSSGLTVSGDQYRTLGQTGVQGRVTANGQFGYALAVGDFNDDSRADLAVGSPGEDIRVGDTPVTSGSVHVFMGGSKGTLIAGNTKWDKFVTAIAEAPTNTDRYGSALATALINRDRTADLIIGSPGSSITVNSVTTTGAGSIRVLYGISTGLTSNSSATINQSSGTNIGTVQQDDNFGAALAMGDYNGDRWMDVAVGVPGDQTGGVKTGGVNVFFGSSGLLSTTDAQLWLPGQDGLKGKGKAGDRFGAALG